MKTNNKYIIEDNINFFLELKKTTTEITKTEKNEKEQANHEHIRTIKTSHEAQEAQDFSNFVGEQNTTKYKNNYCLITNDILNNDSIQLNCGHFFNYKPLFYELTHQKIYKNVFTYFVILNKICPYCRKLIDNSFLLPFKENIINIKIYGINTNDIKYDIKNIKNFKLNEIKKCDNIECYHLATHKSNNNYYCSKDCNINIKLNIKKISNKKKDLLDGEENKNICCAIIKTGINKNKKCCLNTINQTLFCGVHKNYKNKNQNENQNENENENQNENQITKYEYQNEIHNKTQNNNVLTSSQKNPVDS